MSQPEHRTLDEFAPDAEAGRPTFDGARYTGGHDDVAVPEPDAQSNICRNCGHHVAADFARVLGDNDGRVHACPECTESWSDLRYEASGREHPVYGVDWEVFDG